MKTRMEDQTAKWAAIHPGQSREEWKELSWDDSILISKRYIAGMTCRGCPFYDDWCFYYRSKIYSDKRLSECKLVEIETSETKDGL